ncbi:MAG: MMPL family transporter [Ktedonobacterales bacterium]|nr:MMPL family transporter [Ktedonobacterales bacterium]
MLAAFGGGIYRARWVVLIVVLLAVVGAALYGLGVFSALKSGGFQDPAAQSTQAINLQNRQLNSASTDVVILVNDSAALVNEPAFDQAAQILIHSLQARPEIAAVTTYYSTHSASFISKDGHETFFLLRLTGPDKAAQWATLQPTITSPDLHLTFGGNLVVNQQINSQIGADLARAETLTFPIVAVLLIIVFGGLVAAGLPLLVGGIAIFGAFAILRVLTNFTDVSIYATNVVTLIGLGLAIDYALFIVTRFREELARDEQDVQGALRRTMMTAGRTVLFSGLTVGTSLIGLLLFPEYFLRSLGLGAIGAVLVAMLAALTVLPAMLGILGRRINALSVQRLIRRNRPAVTVADQHGGWYRLSQFVMRRPLLVIIPIVALLLTLGSPFLHATFSSPDVRVLPVTAPGRVVSDRLIQDFPQQNGSQASIVVQTTGDALSSTNLANLAVYVQQVQAVEHVTSVQSLVSIDPQLTLADYEHIYANPSLNPQVASFAPRLANGDVTLMTLRVDAADNSDTAQTVVRHLRALVPPSGITPLVDGQTAYQMDLFSNLLAVIPAAALVIVLATFVLLFFMTGSVIVPLKAVVLNVISLSATFGALVFIFQDGHLANLLGFESTGNLDSTQPILIFAIAFGLSMDYEVFLLSRIKEQFDATGDNTHSVATGLQRTGWLITSAAVLLAVVVGAFATSRIIFIQEIGVGLALAVIIDATLVRALLVPATMRLLGKWNWWAPAPLHWLWQRIGLHEAPAPLSTTPRDVAP